MASRVIPPYSSILTTQIEESNAFEECRRNIANIRDTPAIPSNMKPAVIQEQVKLDAEKIAFETGNDIEMILGVLRRKCLRENDDDEASNFSYRAEEYDALNGSTHVHDEDYDGDFIRESTDISVYNLPYIKNISLITKVREVIALLGFTRINPQDSEPSESKPQSFVPVKEKETNWYPAYQVRGEGIFIEFNETDIDKWMEENPDVQKRAEQLNRNYKQSMFGEKRPRRITAKYLLLHTISHLLIKQLSFDCGYSIASLKERIYCGEKADGKQMAGILIYTAGGDTEGTLGGLVRQGRPDVFPRVFRKAIETARICSGDPVCSLSSGQGRDSLNLAACYSCALIPETSCEDFNAFLDRGVVVGTMKRPEIGFFAEQLKSGWSNVRLYVPQPQKEDSSALQKSCGTVIPERGTELDTSGMTWHEIWETLEDYAESTSEKELLEKFRAFAGIFEGREQPLQDCAFRVSSQPDDTFQADLLWLDSHVILLMNDNERCFDLLLIQN